MTWTEASAQAWWATVRAAWPMLPTAQFIVDPSGPSGALTNGVAVITITGFDDLHNMWHEAGHILQAVAQNLRGPSDNPLDGSIGPEFIKARGLPWPYRGPYTTPAPAWRDLGYEQFAEAFARLNIPGEVERAASVDVPWPGDDAMRAFFIGLFRSAVSAPQPARAPAPPPVPAAPPPTPVTIAPAAAVGSATRVWIWLWTIPACEGGDLDAIVAKAKAHDVGVLVKIADGLTVAGAWDPDGRSRELLARLEHAGVPARSWSYVYPTVDLAGQAELALRSGADHILDAEVEWDGHAAEARLLVSYLLSRRATQMIGYAPLPIVAYHDNAGQYEEFNRLDLACPQAYAGTGGRDAIGALEWTQAQWDAAFPRCNIEPAVYAADQDPADLQGALAYVLGMSPRFGNGSASIWSWQHMSDAHWSVVDRFTKGDTMPDENALLDMVDRATAARLAAAGRPDPAFTIPDTIIAVKDALAKLAGAITALQANDVDEAKRLIAAATALVGPAGEAPRGPALMP